LNQRIARLEAQLPGKAPPAGNAYSDEQDMNGG